MMNFKVSEDVYPPSEDTFLIAKHIPLKLKGRHVLDMGCGSGMLGIAAAVNGATVTSIDINPNAILNTIVNAERHNIHVKTIKSNLFSKVHGKFDLILFNPPYVPKDEENIYLSPGMRRATTSGKRGTDTIKKFLKDFKTHLNPNGEVLLIVSSLNKITTKLKKAGWEEIDSEAFFFEKIHLMKYRLK